MTCVCRVGPPDGGGKTNGQQKKNTAAAEALMAAPVAAVAEAVATVPSQAALSMNASAADSEEVAQMEMMKAMGLPCGFDTTSVRPLLLLSSLSIHTTTVCTLG